MKKLKLPLVILFSLLFSSCLTIYKGSTVVEYKGSIELQSDSVSFKVENKTLKINENIN